MIFRCNATTHMGRIVRLFAFALATSRRYAGRHEGDAWVVAGKGV